MKKVLFISKEFTPISNGTVACLENILPYLANKYKITLYASRQSVKDKEEEFLFNTTVKRPRNISDDFVCIKSSLIERINNFKINRKIKKFLIFLIKVLFYPLHYLDRHFGLIYGNAWVPNLYKFINKRENLNNYDILISIGNPFSNIKCAYNIKKKFPHLKLLLIEFDLYAYNPVELINDTKKNNYFGLRLSEEKNWYSISDYIIVINEMYNTIKNSELNKWINKVYPMYMPNLCRLNDNKAKYIFGKYNNSVNIVYTGMFYEDIRNPKFSLALFNVLCKKNPKIKLHIVGFGCEKIVNKFQDAMGENLIVYGHRNKQFSTNARYSADILLNISNKTISQVPSKLFEYIGSCKPIINIYTLDDDICKEYLDKYPFAISIKEDWYQINKLADEIYEFIIKYKGKSCEWDEIKTQYSEFLPESFSNCLIDLMEN